MRPLTWRFREFQHQIVDHAETYVSGQVHTNGIENFGSVLICVLRHGRTKEDVQSRDSLAFAIPRANS
jgi:hypothetical protein